MTALAERRAEIVPAPAQSLPDLAAAKEHFVDLAAIGDMDALMEANRQASAYALYERRAQHREREQHFAVLRLLTEAAIGIVSYDDPDSVIRGDKYSFRALAAALERNKLMEVVQADPTCLGAALVAYRVRAAGLTTVPRKALGIKDGARSVRWQLARKIARDRGISFESLPADLAGVQAAKARRSLQSREMRRAFVALASERRERQRDAMRRAARAKGPSIANALGYLRRTLQALQEAHAELEHGDERRLLGIAMEEMYAAEDYLAEALGIQPPQN